MNRYVPVNNPSRCIRSCLAACLSLLLIGLLAGCAAMTPVPKGAVEDKEAPGEAGQAYARGEYREAARLWQQKAVDAHPSTASRLRLQAADAWLLAGDADAAEDLLPWIDEQQLNEAEVALLNLVRAEIALDQNRPVEARHRLDQVGASLADTYADRYRGVSVRTEAALGAISTRGAQEASDMAREMRGYDAESALALLKQLEQVPSGQLRYLAGLEGDARRAAWFDLALVIRENLVDASGLEIAVEAWKQRHPAVAVTPADALDLWLLYRRGFRPPARVAVLLPASGGLGAAGNAIRDGIMSAYLEQPGGAQIRFYDTGEEAGSVLAAYFQAADDGAQWILGPLDRESVEALLNLAGLATPVLALNDLPRGELMPEGLARQVYGMSLSQEREAAAVARRMAELGHTRAVLLAPESTWGERIARAFQEDFLHDGRQIVTAARYLPEENDHSQVLERALRIDESKARKEQLENRLGIELEFEPVRRSDVDAIFLAADPAQGRLLAPQLRFFDAGDIPTFSTSRVYTGRPDPARNQDLDGLIVPLTAWQIEHASAQSIPALGSLREGEFAALYAIGMDAWNVLPWLDLMRSDPDFRFAGQSGTYALTGGGNLQREPSWSRFTNGTPVRVAETAAGSTKARDARDDSLVPMP